MFKKVIASVLFVQDLAESIAFYGEKLGLPVHQDDAVSASFPLGGQVIILLASAEAPNLLTVGAEAIENKGGYRGLLAASVDDVDAAYQEFSGKGVTFLRQPIDQPWGLRTAHFVDPDGHVWEINQPVASK